MIPPFDLTGPLPRGRTLIEASAGTGKTYTIAALIARYVAGDDPDLPDGIGVDQILVVTFTRAAASELRDRTRAKLRLAADHLDHPPADGPPATDAWLAALDGGAEPVRRRRAARLREALARFDEATITTIHGFCQLALTQAGLRSGTDWDVELVEGSRPIIAEVARDLLVRELADDPLALSYGKDRRPAGSPDCVDPYPPIDVEAHFARTVNAVFTNAGARHAPAPDTGGLAGRWAALVDEAVAAVVARQRADRQIGYDRLVSDLAAALADPTGGPALADLLAARYALVLVDEFQDTDRLQWEIFGAAFGRQRLITVGDPKQAIYRFRGADVHAYLEAVRGAGVASLAVNHRSDRRLLDALAVLFAGATLGHPGIAFTPVAAAPGAPLRAIHEKPPERRPGALDAAIHVRVVPEANLPRTQRGGPEAGAVQRAVLEDVASRVRALLDHATLEEPDGTTRRVLPSDIAVIVPSQRRAADAASTLREWAIPSVRARTGSVLDSQATVHWRLLLAGLTTPTRARVARAAGLSWFCDRRPADLVGDGTAGEVDSPLAQLQRELAVHAHALRTAGIGPFYERIRAGGAMLGSLLARPDGDRHAIDLDHVAELLIAEVGGGPVEPFEVGQALDRLIAADRAGDDAMRRIETDAQAVTITTIHAAKGLEYPVVMLPFAYVERPRLDRPLVYNDGGRVVDVASWVAWADGAAPGDWAAAKAALEERERSTREEIDGDALRLLYVAMTRARHRVELWWAPVTRAGTSAFGRLLFDREGAGPLANSPVGGAFEKRTDARARLGALAAASRGTIAVFDVSLEPAVRRPLDLTTARRPPLAIAEGAGRHPLDDGTWRSWSFTALASRLASSDTHSGPLGLLDAPVVGGADEGTGGPEEQEAPGTSSPTVPLAAVTGGPTFGTMVHEVLEAVDFTSSGLVADVTAQVVAGARRAGLALDTSALAAGLVAAVETPLGPLFDGRSLRSIGRADRVDEMAFDLRLGDGSTAAVPAGAVGEILAAALADDDPLHAYFTELGAALGGVDLRGWLTGSIDAVLRVGDGAAAEARYVVVDYKSNRVHQASAPGDASVLEAYRPDRLADAMAHSHYPLQAALYTVALHRYLAWRLGATYDPARHLGGVAYLFVRGMIGPATPAHGGETYGVFSWQPPAEAVVALDELLRGSRR